MVIEEPRPFHVLGDTVAVVLMLGTIAFLFTVNLKYPAGWSTFWMLTVVAAILGGGAVWRLSRLLGGGRYCRIGRHSVFYWRTIGKRPTNAEWWRMPVAVALGLPFKFKPGRSRGTCVPSPKAWITLRRTDSSLTTIPFLDLRPQDLATVVNTIGSLDSGRAPTPMAVIICRIALDTPFNCRKCAYPATPSSPCCPECGVEYTELESAWTRLREHAARVLQSPAPHA